MNKRGRRTETPSPPSAKPAVRLPLALVLLTAMLAAGPARAQIDSREGIALQNQILELRRDMQLMGSQRGGSALPPPMPRDGGGGGNDLSAQLLDRVASLEEEVRRLRGRVDELANSSQRMQEDLGKQIGDLNFKLQSNASSSPPPRSASPVPAKRPPELAMQEGNAALARRDYDAAEVAAREALNNGRGPRATDAQFLLAQALAGKRDYQGAAIAYDDAYNRSRTGSRAPEALLGVASALAAINERSGACASLDKLNREFPSLRGPLRQNAAAVRTRAGCK